MDPRTTVQAHPVARRGGRSRAAGVPEAIEREVQPEKPRRRMFDPLSPSTCVGRYVVQNVLGRGGMGVVYGAVDPTLGRRVAVKLVRSGRPSTRYRERLQREALALARVCHPNIVTLFDIGTTTHGTFVAMEYVRGIDLRKWLRVTPRSVEEVLQVFTAAGEGLAAAHAAGLVHRDFKPTNVMVTPDRRVKVLDFGLARASPSQDPWLGSTDSSILARRMTRADTVVGTTGYMPPEQLLGREVSPASDQFAFCVALYEALHGARPFPGKTPIEQARSYAAGTRTEVQIRRDVPPRVRAALERGMELEPHLRFRGMAELLEALGPPPPPSRRRRGLLLAAALLATAVMSSAVTSWLAPDEAQACLRR
ncbi:MAG: serine/threonine-protein kinase [Nannocystales bacterium]